MDAREIIDTLGGTKKVADAVGVSPQVVTNWKRRGIPPKVILENSTMFVRALVEDDPQAKKDDEDRGDK